MKTMIIGSPEHKEFQRQEVDAMIDHAILRISDDCVFTEDQIGLLREAIWDIRHAIRKTI